MRAVLPSDSDNVTSFTQIGHIAHLNLKEVNLPFKSLIGLLNCFVEEKETIYAIYFIRTLKERRINVKTGLFLCFIDCTKVYDKLKHHEIIKMLTDINFNSKDLRIIKNSFWQQTATIRINNQIGECHPVKQGVRQDVFYCLMSLIYANDF
jgi:hypothetical protein